MNVPFVFRLLRMWPAGEGTRHERKLFGGGGKSRVQEVFHRLVSTKLNGKSCSSIAFTFASPDVGSAVIECQASTRHRAFTQ